MASKPKDGVWKFFGSQNEGGKMIAFCNFCKTAKYSQNASRMKEHLGKCSAAPQNIRRIYEEYDSHKSEKRPSTPASGRSSRPTESEESEAQGSEIATAKPAKKPLCQFIDSISPQESSEADRLLARTIYAEGLPFRLVESPHFRSFLNFLRPSYGIPSRQQIAGRLLTIEDERVVAERKVKIESAESVSLLTDGWSGCDNRSLINFLVACPEPIFFKSIDSGIESHTAEFIASKVREVIEEVGPPKVAAVLSDNAAPMKAAWKIIIENFPHILCYPCGCHCCNLAMKDICLYFLA